MHVDTIIALGPSLLLLAAAITLFAGFVKGATGFGMPMLMISGLGSFLPPELALAGLILPALAANLWQAFRQGWAAAAASAREHWRFLAVLLTCIAIGAQFVTALPGATLFLVIGVPVTVFAGLQLAGWRPRIDRGRRRPVEFAAGTLAGLVGGLSGVWGPPTVLYLTAMDTPKIEHVRVQGVVYATGAVMLTLAHLQSGVLNWTSARLSLALLVPAMAGMALGFMVHDRLDQKKFRRLTLVVLTLAGLNLVRRGLTG